MYAIKNDYSAYRSVDCLADCREDEFYSLNPDLDAGKRLYDTKQGAIKRMTSLCREHIIGGVDLNGLHYPTTRDDQADINRLFAGAKELGVAGEPYKFICMDAQGVWLRRDHTAAQITDVALAVLQHELTTKNRLDGKLAEVEAVSALPAPTQADFDAIVW